MKQDPVLIKSPSPQTCLKWISPQGVGGEGELIEDLLYLFYFQVGKDFDALLIDAEAEDSPFDCFKADDLRVRFITLKTPGALFSMHDSWTRRSIRSSNFVRKICHLYFPLLIHFGHTDNFRDSSYSAVWVLIPSSERIRFSWLTKG